MGMGKDGKGKGMGKEWQGYGKGDTEGPGQGDQKGHAQQGTEAGHAQGQAAGSGQRSTPGKGPSPGPQEGSQGQASGMGKGKGKGNHGAKIKRKARAERQTVTDRSNTVKDGDFNVPWFHRRRRVPPKELRHITEQLVKDWDTMSKDGGQRFHDPTLRESLSSWCSESMSEAQFQHELRNARDFVERNIFGHMLPRNRIVRDITGAGEEVWLNGQLWVGGPAFRELEGDAQPVPPGNTYRNGKKTVWDFWVTDYNPNFWEHVFGDCQYTRYTDAEGKGLCPSSGAASVARSMTEDEIWEALPGKGIRPSEKVDRLMPRQSWFRYHGTGMHAAMTAVSMNSLNRSGKTRGLPSPGDPKNYTRTGRELMDDTYGTAAGRGVYCTADFNKAHASSIPFCDPDEMKIQVHIVLLVRVPGSLQMTGVLFPCCPRRKKWWPKQKDEAGNDMRLDERCTLMELGGRDLREVLRRNGADFEEVMRLGVQRWLREGNRKYTHFRWTAVAPVGNSKITRALQAARQRQGHQGEPRWTYMIDQNLYETVSSHVAVVGIFMGYQVVDSKNGQITCKRGQAEIGINWSKVPGLTRVDDVEERNAKLEKFRAEKERKQAEAEAVPPPPGLLPLRPRR